MCAQKNSRTKFIGVINSNAFLADYQKQSIIKAVEAMEQDGSTSIVISTEATERDIAKRAIDLFATEFNGMRLEQYTSLDGFRVRGILGKFMNE